MITLCVPTRGRPQRFAEMVASARATSSGEFEVVACIDEDDYPYPEVDGVRYLLGRAPRDKQKLVKMSGLWTKAAKQAKGDIMMLAADDIVFETPGWDARVQEAFDQIPDRILMVYARNGQDDRPLLPFVSREWVKAAGFTPDDLQGWFSDEYIWSIAAEVGRVVFLDDVMIRHNQYGDDETYASSMRSREMAGGFRGMRRRFYSIPEVEKRDELVEELRHVMVGLPEIKPEPTPQWYTDSLTMNAKAREHARLMREETVVVVHCYKGDRKVAANAMPLFKHHGAPVLVLSPEDSQVSIRSQGVSCMAAGKAAYFGQDSLDRQRAHLQLMIDEYPSRRFFLLNDADSLCLDPVIPRYLYERAVEGIVFSNEVRDWREHPSPYPKIAMHPPYFLTRESIERMLAVAPRIQAHPITPYIDWYMVALTIEAGLLHASYPDGVSFPAWRRKDIPETQQLGHDYVHRNDPDGYIHGDDHMEFQVSRGATLIHSVKHAEVLKRLLKAHAEYVSRGSPPAFNHTISLQELIEQQRARQAEDDKDVIEHERGQAGMSFGESVRI